MFLWDSTMFVGLFVIYMMVYQKNANDKSIFRLFAFLYLKYRQQRELAIVKWEYILHQKIFWEYGQERILLKMFHLLIIVR